MSSWKKNSFAQETDKDQFSKRIIYGILEREGKAYFDFPIFYGSWLKKIAVQNDYLQTLLLPVSLFLGMILITTINHQA